MKKNDLRLMEDILTDEGYTVFTADNGLVVEEKACEFLPDVILLDIMMPGLDGFEVCRRLKENPAIRDIPVLMVTAKTEGADLKRAFENGAADYIKKPVDEVEVVARIQAAMKYRENRDRLIEIASRDSLTGIFTHAVMLELLERETANRDRDGEPLAFIMLDVDFFKRINDTYGHPCGDVILKGIAGILQGILRKGDIIGRYGGEEFGLVIPGSGKDDVLRICDRIRKSIEDHPFYYEGSAIRVTVSMGLYFREIGDRSGAERIIKKADEALYMAKYSGRNRVEIVNNKV